MESLSPIPPRLKGAFIQIMPLTWGTHPWMTGAMWRRLIKARAGLNHNLLCHLPPWSSIRLR